jgi:3D (Asp-Asp-Asp) domain-containing protein
LIRNTFLCLAALCASSLAKEIEKPETPAAASAGQVIEGVKTTAYTHTEADHIEYGARSAVGSGLKYGKVRSAAADWSVYPVGTVFQIEGDSSLYIVDDYGSALVGTKTIDLYKPSQGAMSKWGARKVNIKIVKWGSYEKSLAILRPRQHKASHVREMVTRLNSRSA